LYVHKNILHLLVTPLGRHPIELMSYRSAIRNVLLANTVISVNSEEHCVSDFEYAFFIYMLFQIFLLGTIFGVDDEDGFCVLSS